MKDQIANLRTKLSNQENETAESIREAFAEMQKASLKLFEIAYKKVNCCSSIIWWVCWVNIIFIITQTKFNCR